ncbi:MAG TPA: hypothetical protein VK084_06120 [Chitinophagaceae bacterium]|nr:hypothetical protein [Chitinophagaceae bacterium]
MMSSWITGVKQNNRTMQGLLRIGFLLIIWTFIVEGSVFAQDYSAMISDEDEQERLNKYERELESYMKHFLIDDYDVRADSLWDRDYSSIAAFKRSIVPNISRWRDIVIKPPTLRVTGEMKRTSYNLDGLQGEWVQLPLENNLSAQGILVIPKNAGKGRPVPLVITQHGIGSSPERPFTEDGKSYHAYARKLVEAGFAVLSPLNLRSVQKRNNIERYTRLANISLPGIEFSRTQNLLDVILQDERIDAEKVGMWGVSLGGMATAFWMPLEERIKVGVISAWFNDRINKMIVQDSRWSSFVKNNEEYVFLTGWLQEFSERDLVSMICPRPLQIQHGKKDGIAHWPYVVSEFEKSKDHYDKLEIGDRIELVLHEGRHEAKVEEGVKFLKKFLMD